MKRILSIFLCFAFLCSMLPAAAMPHDREACDPEAEAWSIAQSQAAMAAEAEEENDRALMVSADTPTGKYCVDFPSAVNGKSFSSSVKIRGWILDKNDVVEVTYQIDGRDRIYQGTQEARTDVAAVFPGYPTGKEGFSDEIDIRDYAPGSHTLKITYTTGDGTVYTISTDFSVSGQPLPVYNFNLNGHEYYVYDGGFTYSQAKSWAEGQKLRLATVFNEEHAKALADAASRGERSYYWVGAEKTNNQLTWSYNSVPVSAKMGDITGSYALLDAKKATLKAASAADAGFDVGFICERIDIEPARTATYGTSVFTLYDEVCTYAQAKAYAAGANGALASFASEAEKKAVLEELGTMDGYWISATNTRLMRDGSTETATDPNFTGFIVEHSGDIQMSAGVSASNGHTYYRVDAVMTWDAARAVAEMNGGRLAVLSGSVAQNAIKGILSGGACERYWVGGNDRQEEGVYRWLDGSVGIPRDVICMTNEPNDYNKNEDYLMVYRDYEGRLNDANQLVPGDSDNVGTMKYGFIFELFPESKPDKVDYFGGHVYARFDKEVWAREARSRATVLRGNLVSVDSDAEAAFLLGFMADGAENYWAEDYLTAISATYGRVGKKTDVDTFGYIVEYDFSDLKAVAKNVYNNSTYLAFDAGVPWYVAECAAQMMGGHLASVANASEQKAVETVIAKGANKHYYIGGEKVSGSFAWTDGTAFSYTNWKKDQPDNYGTGEYYIEIEKETMQWNDDGIKPGVNKPLCIFGFVAEIPAKDELQVARFVAGREGSFVQAIADFRNLGTTAKEGTILIAAYDADGRALDVQSKIVTVDAYSVASAVKELTADNAAMIGAFFWDNKKGLIPLATTPVPSETASVTELDSFWTTDVPSDVADMVAEGIYVIRNKETGEYLSFKEYLPASGTMLTTKEQKSSVFSMFKMVKKGDGMAMYAVASNFGENLIVTAQAALGSGATLYPVLTEDGSYYIGTTADISTVWNADLTAVQNTGADSQKWELFKIPSLEGVTATTIDDGEIMYTGAGKDYTKVMTLEKSGIALSVYGTPVNDWYYVSYAASEDSAPVYGYIHANDITFKGGSGSTMSYAEAKALHNRNGSGQLVAKGVDISSWQGTPDFTAMKNGGYTFVILRAGYTGSAGGKAKDSTFETKYAAAKAAGMHIGAYYYTYCTTNASAQSEVNAFTSYISGKTFEYPIYMDLEAPGQKFAGIGSVASAFCSYLENAGYFAGVYASASVFNSYIGGGPGNNYEYWVAHYGTSYAPTHYANTYGMWQHTDTGGVPGHNAHTDQNYCYKDYPNMVKALGMNGY